MERGNWVTESDLKQKVKEKWNSLYEKLREKLKLKYGVPNPSNPELIQAQEICLAN